MNELKTKLLRAWYLPREPRPRLVPESQQKLMKEFFMKVKPLGDRIIVRRFDAADKSAGGIILPDNAKSKPQKGKVLAVGPGKFGKDGNRQPLQLKEGDSILFTTWAGDEFKEKAGDTILVMREEDVLAVVDE